MEKNSETQLANARNQIDIFQKKIDKLEQENLVLSNPENYGELSKIFPFKSLDLN